MSDNEKFIQLDEFFAMFEALERRLSRLENSFDVHRRAVDAMSDNVYSMYKKITSIKEDLVKLDNMESDLEADTTHIFHLMYGCGDFCGNCEHCISCPDGLYRCDLTNLELDPDTSSCIRFKSPQNLKSDAEILKSDAEVCKECPGKDTPLCNTCSCFPF